MKSILAAALVLAAAACPARAALVVSSGATNHMSCSAGVCSPTSKNAVLNTGDLQTMLASGDVTVETANGAEAIAVITPLAWASMSRLTLSSVHSVSFKAAVAVQGTAGLTLVTDGHQPGGDVLFYPGGSVAFWDTASSLTIDGTSYTLVNDIATLASDVKADSSGAYALAGDYDASVDGSYSQSAVTTFFGGRFEGLGHAIQNLSFIPIQTKKNLAVAFFHAVSPRGIVRDIALTNVAMTDSGASAPLAPLVGTNNGAIVNASVTGSIGGAPVCGGLVVDANTGSTILNSRSSFSLVCGFRVGGIAVLNEGSIVNSYATGTFTSLKLGGLVVDNNGPNASIVGSHASVSLIFTPNGGQAEAGGLVDTNEGSIASSYASGSFTENSYPNVMAGLVVSNAGAISSSWSNSAIAMAVGGAVAGLVEYNAGTIVNSYATGNLSSGGARGSENVQLGGLTVFNSGSIAGSYATGSVTDLGPPSETTIGGFTGINEGTIADCYAFGAVSGNRKAYAAGFSGALYSGSITGSYSTGFVSGGLNPNTEGFVAFTDGGTVGDSYWDVDTSGQRKSKAGTPISDAALKAALPAGFDAAVWAQSASINNGYPYLIANPPQ